ncbi:hypothetical protein JK628_08450 [Shewanella sp. KX20019]|uniref:DUF6445 family protein n=1 Tax=Shewanella sp. KX20019 TaxID=2803864 RepID=UPI001927F3DB|nr:DUF6445 family protein [Shewanella sp. KX20019]QQX81844.1 hypothetical protein JK628_08450 [Shewanella sp. KX20019]
MQQNMITVNPVAKPNIVLIGTEKTPVVIIDDFALSTDGINAYAADHADFKADRNSYYPGIRAALPREYVKAVIDAVYQGIYQCYKIPHQLRLKPQSLFLSLITQEESKLTALQKMPHFDTPKPYHFAILHYLNPNQHGPTGFFRHRPTQWERITAQRCQPYFDAAQLHIEVNGEPKKGYCTESDHHFDLYEQIEYRPNRLVIYPGNLLHSSIVKPAQDIDSNPNTGRLTANIFIDFK